MAGAYARLSGKLGVCIASNGPGVANILPGIAVENAEGNRVLLITSSRRSPIIHPDRGGTYQCFDQVAVTKPMTKWSTVLPGFKRVSELLERALRMSNTGRPGVIHLDVPEDVINSKLKDVSKPIITMHVPAACGDVFRKDSVAVFDGGATAVWSHFYHTVRVPNSLVSTPHFGHLGAGTGQALGAAVARPSKQVYCITGDGAFGFHLQEIETAVRHHLPVVFLVVCDRQWGMVKMSQQFSLKPVKTVIKKSLGPDETIGTELGEIAFDRLAESMGAYGERVADPRELKPALQRCIDTGKCSVVHVDVNPVKHMWAPGLKDFKKMHQEPS